MTEERKYKYSANGLMIFLGLLMFGGCSLLFYYKAINNDSALIINNIIQLDINKANIFYWLMFTLSILMTLMFLAGIYFKIKETNYLIIDNSKIIIPPIGFRRKFTEIPFTKISELDETKVNGNHILTLYFEDEKRDIASSLLKNKKKYLEIKKLIVEKINEA